MAETVSEPHHAHDFDVDVAALFEAVRAEPQLWYHVPHAVHDLLHVTSEHGDARTPALRQLIQDEAMSSIEQCITGCDSQQMPGANP